MTDIAPRADLGSHEVINQPLPREGGDLWAADIVLR